MPIRQNNHPQTGKAAAPPHRRPDRRAALLRWCLVVLPVIALSAFVIPAGLASAAGERTPAEEEAKALAKQNDKLSQQAEREQLATERKAQRDTERTERKSARKTGHSRMLSKQGPTGAKDSASKEHGTVTISCSDVRWDFKDFDPERTNTISYKLTVRDQAPPKTTAGTFSFDGASGSQTTPFHATKPGGFLIDAAAHWKMNGLKGGFDIHLKSGCPPLPAFTIEKLQTIAGSELPFTTSTLPGEVGQTVDYEILVHNTGNVALTFGALSDAHCDKGTISGGPGANPVAPEGSTTYMCSHVLTEADATAGSYSNNATTTGTPPAFKGSPVTHTSNTVVVTVNRHVPAPAFTLEKLQKIDGEGSFTTSTLSGKVGQTVDYEIRVKNTGNVTLSMGALLDTQCDTGTISGGPIGGMLAPGASTSYLCSHVLSSADQTAGSYSNAATLVGTPPDGEGEPITHTTNTVVVTVPPGPSSPPSTPGSGSSSGSSASSGVLSSTVNQSQSGVLGFASATVPALKVPSGCARKNFKASLKSAGVHTVVFYLDGHKLKTMTAKSARKGLISIEINPAKLKVGPHKLMAKITMNRTGSAKATRATRSVTVLRCRAALLTPKFTG